MDRPPFVAKVGILAAIVAVALLLMGPVADGRMDHSRAHEGGLIGQQESQGIRSLALHWNLRRITGPKSFQADVVTDTCVGAEAKPLRVHLRSRPGRVDVTVFRTVDESAAPKQCRRIARKRTLTVRLPGYVSETDIFDGSFKPPKLKHKAVV